MSRWKVAIAVVLLVLIAGGSAWAFWSYRRADRETGEISHLPVDLFMKTIRVNLLGTFQCVAKAATGMMTLDGLEDGERGAMVVTSSVAAEDGHGGLLAAAYDLADAIIENSEYGVYMTKIGMWANVDAPSLRHAIELENRTQVLGCFTGNMTEAGEAFREKRAPSWKPF